jgi:hypothetical protein
MVRRAGLGDEPRRALAESSKISLMEAALPTRSGIEIRRRQASQPRNAKLSPSSGWVFAPPACRSASPM